MRRILLATVTCLALVAAHATVRNEGGHWVLENELLQLTVDRDSARMTVLEKQSGTTWSQADPARQAANRDNVVARRAPAELVIDGDPAEWAFVPHPEWVWLPWMGENGESNCSAGAKVLWDDENLYLYVRVRDNQIAFGGDAATEWWEADSVEFWVDAVQVGLHLAPEGREVAVNARGDVYEGSRVAVRRVTEPPLPGYELEVAVPLRHFPVLIDPEPGIRFSVAIGMNDADPEPEPGAPVRRDRQSYSPTSWVHSAPATFSTAVLAAADGSAPARSRDNDRSAVAGSGRPSNMAPGPEPDSLIFAYEVLRGQPVPLSLHVTLQLVPERPWVDITIDCPSNKPTPMEAFRFPAALYPTDPTGYFLAVANYTNGRYLPVADPYCRQRQFCIGGGDLPFVVVTDGAVGLSAILLTPWDGAIQMQVRTDDEQQAGFPGFRWLPRKGLWGETRKARLSFIPTGGYVTAAKQYRALAREQGLVRTLREKAETRPDVKKLFGAVNWWGAGGVGFVREAMAAGMTRGLVNGRPPAEDMREIAARGWLIGEYDNYEDINDSDTVARAKAPVATHAVVKEDGEFMTAWITRDKDMNPIHTYMKQCAAMMPSSARIVIPKVLDTHPYNTRFLDVTTATGLKECYSPTHPVTRREDQASRVELLKVVSDELGLVAGGEHGRYWSVPHLDYHEGLMGGALYSWPAGYLRDVTSRDELTDRYLTYSINPANRVPLFELVFHDCVVNYWYWGACSDYLHQMAPEITDRKTAMNVLYGTPPMMWAHSHGLRWQVPEEREKMLEIYRNVCKLHEVVADQEMLSHEFLTADRMVQRTVFADGTRCTVNFGDQPYRIALSAGEGSHPDRDAGDGPWRRQLKDAPTLRRNDVLVLGPKVTQWRLTQAGDDAQVEHYIRTDSCIFADVAGRPYDTGTVRGVGRVWSTKIAPERIQVALSAGSRAELDLNAWGVPGTDRAIAVFAANADGTIAGRVARPTPWAPAIPLRAPDDSDATFLILTGDEALTPDVTVTGIALTADGEPLLPTVAPALDARLEMVVSVANNGLAAATGLTVALRLDSETGPRLGAWTPVTVPAGASRRFTAVTPIRRMDGGRRVVASIEGADATTVSGRLQAQTGFTGPFAADAFPHRQSHTITVASAHAGGLPVELPYAPGPADPANLRVRFADGQVAPAQFEPREPGADEGTVVFVLPGGLAAGTQAITILGPDVGDTNVYAHRARFEVSDDASRLRFETYAVSLTDGMLSNLRVLRTDGSEALLASALLVSCKETGWSRETGTVQDLSVVHRGPVRVVVTCRKLVSEQFLLTRTWRFYGDRFEVDTEVTPHIGCRTRMLFAADGTVTNQTGAAAAMDGQGEGEDFGFTGRPRWYAAFTPEWSLACIALTPAAGITYWDSGTHRGQISLDHPSEEPLERRLFIIGRGAADDVFAQQAARAYLGE